MADISIGGFDELIQKFDKLGDQSFDEEVGKHMVDAAVPLTVASMKSALAGSESGPQSSGSVAASIVPTVSKVNSYGAYSVARPTGYDSKGVRNGLKAAILEYGTKRGFAKRPWRDKAVNSVQGAAVKAMEEVLKSEMELD